MPRFATGISGLPSIIFLASFGILIGLGTIAFSLPAATKSGGLPFAEALFTATSAVCVTGLTVVDVGQELTPFGQWTLLVLIQLGALGLMTFYALTIMMVGQAIPFIQRTLVREIMTPTGLRGVHPVRVLRSVVLFTLLLEGAGTAAFYALFRRTHEAADALKMAVFHAVSAFCNAGFSLQGDSFVRWNADIGVNFVLIALIVTGGLGFFVLTDLGGFWWAKLRMSIALWRGAPVSEIVRGRHPLSLHTKIVLLSTAALLALGFVVFWAEFLRHSGGGHFGVKVLEAFFLSVTARTAGFNTVPTEGLSSATAVLLIGLMFTGASPASTGGGIKTTTMFVLLASLWSRMKGRAAIDIFKKTIPDDINRRASVIFFLAVGVLGLALFLLFAIEEGNPAIDNTPRPFLMLLFEGVSAFGTVGLSMGATDHLAQPSLFLLSILMFIGRVGPMTMFIALSGPPRLRPRHPDELVMVG